MRFTPILPIFNIKCKTRQLNLISGYIPAAKDLWILGDAFVMLNFHAFADMNAASKGNH